MSDIKKFNEYNKINEFFFYDNVKEVIYLSMNNIPLGVLANTDDIENKVSQLLTEYQGYSLIKFGGSFKLALKELENKGHSHKVIIYADEGSFRLNMDKIPAIM